MAARQSSSHLSITGQSFLGYCAGTARLDAGQFQRDYEQGHAARLLELLAAKPGPVAPALERTVDDDPIASASP